MWVASPWGFSEMIQPARYECPACCPQQAEKPGIQPVVGKTRGTHVEQVVSFQKILRGSQLTWYIQGCQLASFGLKWSTAKRGREPNIPNPFILNLTESPRWCMTSILTVWANPPLFFRYSIPVLGLAMKQRGGRNFDTFKDNPICTYIKWKVESSPLIWLLIRVSSNITNAFSW